MQSCVSEGIWLRFGPPGVAGEAGPHWIQFPPEEPVSSFILAGGRHVTQVSFGRVEVASRNRWPRHLTLTRVPSAESVRVFVFTLQTRLTALVFRHSYLIQHERAAGSHSSLSPLPVTCCLGGFVASPRFNTISQRR